MCDYCTVERSSSIKKDKKEETKLNDQQSLMREKLNRHDPKLTVAEGKQRKR